MSYNPKNPYLGMPCTPFRARISRPVSQVLLSMNPSVRSSISRELVLPVAKDLVNLVGLWVHPTSSLEIHNVFYFVELDGLDGHIVSRWNMATGIAKAYLIVEVKVPHVPTPLVRAVMMRWDCRVG